MIRALTTSRAQAPRARFRGKKRYFRRVRERAEAFRLAPSTGEWWDLWHYHADWPGWGNRSWRYRRQHLRALTTVFSKIAAVAEQFTTPFQLWIFLSGRDAGQDATYLHTPSPNHVPFPLRMADGIDWNHQPLLSLFAELLPSHELRIGESRRFDEHAEPPRFITSFFVYSPGLGVPLEADRRDT